MMRIGEETLSVFTDVRQKLADPKCDQSTLEFCTRGLAHLERCLKKRPRVVVVGEANVGKTSMINTLLGKDMLPTGVLANTPVSVTLKHGAQYEMSAITARGVVRVDASDPLRGLRGSELKAIQISMPNQYLKAFDLVDTPSDAGVVESVANADMVIWCTLATRAWGETERRAWLRVPYRLRKNSLLVATNADGILDADEFEKVRTRLSDCTAGLFRSVFFSSHAVACEVSGGVPFDGVLAEGLARDKAALLEQIEFIAAGVMERRVRAAKRIAERLARVAHERVDVGLGSDRNLEPSISGRWMKQWERLLAAAAETSSLKSKPGLSAGSYRSGVDQNVTTVAA